MGVKPRVGSGFVDVKRDEHSHTLSLTGSESDESDVESPSWSLGAIGSRQQERQLATPRRAAWRQLTPCTCGALLSGLMLALLTWGAMHLAHSRQLHLDFWREAGSAAGSKGPSAGGFSGGQQDKEQQQKCQLDLDGSPWEQHCQRLRRVCVDQGTLILYDDRYQQLDGRKAGQLPELVVSTSKIYEYPWRQTSSSSKGADGGGSKRRRLLYDVLAPGKNRRIPPLPMRPAAAEEPTPYLQQPRFSTCTVPVLLYSSWRANFFHIFKDMGAQVYSLLRRTPWRRHAKLVLVTPEGLPLTQPEAQLLPRLSEMSVQSFADFSRRVPEGFPAWGQLDASQPSPSFEGGEQRCFETVFFCGANFPMARGLPREEEAQLSEQQRLQRLAKEVPVEPFSFGQAVAAHVQQQRRQRQQTGQGMVGAVVPDAISLQEVSAEAGGKHAATSGRLKVVVTKRDGEGRQILNAAELLEQCNSWRYTPPGSSTPVTAECKEVSLPDLESGVEAARKADVLLGIHGANLANGWLMRPGSSVIEVTPYQFEYGRGSFVFSRTNGQDATSQILWWVAVLCDPAASTPGPSEAAGTGLEDWWPRDRNVRLPWSTVDQVLREVVKAGGDRDVYVEQYYGTGRHRFNFNAQGAVGHERRCPNVTLPEP